MSHLTYAARAFGTAILPPSPPPVARLEPPASGEILAVLGRSGAGKTRAIRALNGVGPPPIRPDMPVLEHFPSDLPSPDVLRALALAGLGDGRLWVMRAAQLSAGEQQRLRVAMLLCLGPPLLALDEFDAHLDADTACALAQAVGNLVRRLKLRAVVSTHRPEVLPFLRPDRVVRITGGSAAPEPAPPPADALDGLTFTPGRARDWQRFAHWHYLGSARPGPVAGVWLAHLHGEAVGIAMFGYPHLLLSARRDALPPEYARRDPARLNRDVRLLQRVVVDPRLRGLGVAARLVAHGVRALGVPWVECLAQLGPYSGFLRAAGFERIRELDPPRQLAALRRFCERREIDPGMLHHAEWRKALLERLPAPDAEALQRHLRNVLQSRISTGHGAGRRGGKVAESVLDAALSRIDSRPTYFVWSRHA
jgi:NitT/TauT family transport system ATP-binding protein